MANGKERKLRKLGRREIGMRKPWCQDWIQTHIEPLVDLLSSVGVVKCHVIRHWNDNKSFFCQQFDHIAETQKKIKIKIKPTNDFQRKTNPKRKKDSDPEKGGPVSEFGSGSDKRTAEEFDDGARRSPDRRRNYEARIHSSVDSSVVIGSGIAWRACVPIPPRGGRSAFHGRRSFPIKAEIGIGTAATFE